MASNDNYVTMHKGDDPKIDKFLDRCGAEFITYPKHLLDDFIAGRITFYPFMSDTPREE